MNCNLALLIATCIQQIIIISKEDIAFHTLWFKIYNENWVQKMF